MKIHTKYSPQETKTNYVLPWNITYLLDVIVINKPVKLIHTSKTQQNDIKTPQMLQPATLTGHHIEYYHIHIVLNSTEELNETNIQVRLFNDGFILYIPITHNLLSVNICV